jgi:competence protein ComEA
MFEFDLKTKLIACSIVVNLILLGSLGYFLFRQGSSEQLNVNELNELEIMVYIDGEVLNPGLYTLNEGTRLNDLVILAGGLTSEANEKAINLSIKLKDEMKVTIPNINKQTESGEELININTASLSELMTLNGIGEVKANAIISFRQKHYFTRIEEIMLVSGIGEKTFESIKANICV